MSNGAKPSSVVTFTPVEKWHIHYIAANMREDDANECRACGYTDLVQCLEMSVAMSAESYTISVGDIPVCIWGVISTIIPGAGVIWLLGTDDVVENRKLFLQYSKEYIPALLQKYRVLTNLIWEKNTAHIRWLQWLGFDLFPYVHPVGPHGEPFLKFEMRVT